MPKDVVKKSVDHSVCLVAYNKEEVKQYGSCTLKVNYGKKTMLIPFYVVSSKFTPIIGLDALHKLGLITIHCPIHQSWTSSSPTNTSLDAVLGEPSVGYVPNTLTKEWIVDHPKYRHLFKGIGRFKCNPVHITLSKNAVLMQKPPRRGPLALKEQFRNELDNIVSQGILTKLDDANTNAPEWLNSFFIVKNPNGNLHICLDPTDLNSYIVRPVCNSRTLDEIINLLKDAVHFALLDSTKGFFHVPMDEASKLLTAMLTPVGIYIYNILAMGLSNATDIFKSCIHQILEGLNGVINIADDVLVYGTDHESFKANVIGFLDRCVEKDPHLNPDKVCINIPNVPFLGQVLTFQGLQHDPCNVHVIQQRPTPTCIAELQSSLGYVNYLCKFIPYVSDLCQPLQELLKSSNEFVWTQVHDTAFTQVKQAICKDITLRFFDSDLPLYIEVDASKKVIPY